MGLYNSYEGVQFKVAEELSCHYYKVGDFVDIPDGLYLGWAGFVVVKAGVLLGVYDTFTDTHKEEWPADQLLGMIWHGKEYEEMWDEIRKRKLYPDELKKKQSPVP